MYRQAKTVEESNPDYPAAMVTKIIIIHFERFVKHTLANKTIK